MIKHFNIKIYGQVQGVFFRYYTQKKAQELNLVGFVRNESDKTVYIEAEGRGEKIKKFLDWCRNGSELAKVEKIDFKEGEVKNYIEFVVRY